MFCPKCAAQNIDGASFCRVCGANISLVPQALTGQLPQAQPTEMDFGRGRRGRKSAKNEPPSLEKGIVNVFVGIGFIVAALAIMLKFPAGIFWGWTFFFPAFDRLGRGIASIVAARKLEASAMRYGNSNSYLPPTQRQEMAIPAGEPHVPRTGELVAPPPSVTENTTRHLGAEAPTRHLDSQSDYQK